MQKVYSTNTKIMEHHCPKDKKKRIPLTGALVEHKSSQKDSHMPLFWGGERRLTVKTRKASSTVPQIELCLCLILNILVPSFSQELISPNLRPEKKSEEEKKHNPKHESMKSQASTRDKMTETHELLWPSGTAELHLKYCTTLSWHDKPLGTKHRAKAMFFW